MPNLPADVPFRRRETVSRGTAVDAASSCEIASLGEAPLLRDVMTPTPTCVAPEASVLQLVRTFHTKKFRHLLVTTDGGKLVGIVSDRDVVRCFGPTEYPDESKLADIRTDSIMSRDVITIGADSSIANAIDSLREHGVSSLPVIDGEHLVGIVTTSDLLRLLRRMLVE